MKLETLLKTVLVLLIVGLAAVVGSWFTSEFSAARAQGGGGSASGEWMMVSSELSSGNGLIYLFNTQKQVLLVYGYHRGFVARATRNTFQGDLQFLAGRHCQWDLLFSQLVPFPYVGKGVNTPPPEVLTPGEMKKLFEAASKVPGAGGER